MVEMGHASDEAIAVPATANSMDSVRQAGVGCFALLRRAVAGDGADADGARRMNLERCTAVERVPSSGSGQRLRRWVADVVLAGAGGEVMSAVVGGRRRCPLSRARHRSTRWLAESCTVPRRATAARRVLCCAGTVALGVRACGGSCVSGRRADGVWQEVCKERIPVGRCKTTAKRWPPWHDDGPDVLTPNSGGAGWIGLLFAVVVK